MTESNVPRPNPEARGKAEVRDLLARIDALHAELARAVGSGIDAVISDVDGGVWLLPPAAEALSAQSSASAREADFRASVIDAVPANVAVLDGHGVVVAVNARWSAFAVANGGDPDGYVGTSYYASSGAELPTELQGLGADDARYLLAGVRDVVEGRRPRFDDQYPCHSPDARRWFRMSVTAIAGGGAVVTHFDVTDLVEQRLELERAERRHRAVFDSVSDALCVVDPRGVIVAANEAARALLGPAPHPVGRDVRTYFGAAEGDAADGPPAALVAFEATLGDVQARRLPQAALRTGAGDLVPVAVGIAPIGPKVREEEGVVVLFVDLRDRIVLENRAAAVQRLDALGQLTGGVAHDFNNLLTVVAGNAEMIAAADVPESARRAALLVRAAADRGAAMTRRLLSFASRQPLVPEPVDVAHAVSASMPMLTSSIGRDYALRIDVGEVRATVHVDRVGLDAAIANLVLNARDAMPAGGAIEIVVREERIAPGAVGPLAAGRYARIEVRDAGAGVPPALRERVFEPFFTTKPAGKGTGLGLSTVHGLARRAGGHVDVTDRADGTGAVVRLWLPIDPEGRPGTAEPAAAATRAPARPAAGERVLVIDDDDAVRAYLTAAIEGLGHVVVAEPDGARGLARLRADEHVTVLVTDVVMPGALDGLAVARAARRERPSIGIVVTTGYAPMMLDAPSSDDGYVLLSKPFDRAALQGALDEARAAVAD